MDALTSILLYACAAVAVAGALVAAIAPVALRWLGVLAVAAGTAAVLALLEAGFAAVVFLVCGAACAVLVRRLDAPAEVAAPVAGGLLRQVGGIAAAVLFAVLAYAAFRGSFSLGAYPGGGFNSAALGRLLLDHDVLAGVAAGGLLLAGIAGAAASWRTAR